MNALVEPIPQAVVSLAPDPVVDRVVHDERAEPHVARRARCGQQEEQKGRLAAKVTDQARPQLRAVIASKGMWNILCA